MDLPERTEKLLPVTRHGDSIRGGRDDASELNRLRADRDRHRRSWRGGITRGRSNESAKWSANDDSTLAVDAFRMSLNQVRRTEELRDQHIPWGMVDLARRP
jgi:hypothetical protein